MSKFCGKCGFEMVDAAVICVNCGCQVAPSAPTQPMQQPMQQQYQQPMQQQYQQPMGYPVEPVTQAPAKKTSIILGILGIIMAWLFALVGHVLCIIGIVTGIKEYKETGKMTGLVLSIIGEVCAVISSIIGAVTMAGIY